MDWNELGQYRGRIAVGLALLLLVGWWLIYHRPRAEESARLAERAELLARERDDLARSIAEEEQRAATAVAEPELPKRLAPAIARQMSPVDRLNFFLENVTAPANDLDLSYFAVTPEAPRPGPNYEEMPFSISVSGRYGALADYLYQLEYGKDFVVRNLSLTANEGGLQADFQLAALLPNDPAATASIAPDADPGRPTSLELARDPFVKPPGKLATNEQGRGYFLNVPAGLSLAGIMSTNGRPAAIINHEPYSVGDTIENKKITKIGERGVELTDDVRTYFLEMEQPPKLGTDAQKEGSTR